MTDKERLEEIKELVKKIESILYDEWRQQELTNLIESLYYDDHVDWLINRVEKLETQLSINTNNMKHLQNKIERYKQALEFYADPMIWREGNRIKGNTFEMPLANNDNGHKARKALAGDEL